MVIHVGYMRTYIFVKMQNAGTIFFNQVQIGLFVLTKIFNIKYNFCRCISHEQAESTCERFNDELQN